MAADGSRDPWSTRGWKVFDLYSLVLDRGSLGPSTVTLMALVYVATWGGVVDTVMVMLKLFPGKRASVKSVKSKNLEYRGEGIFPRIPISQVVGRSIYHRSSPDVSGGTNQFCDRPIGCGRPTESRANRDLNSLRFRPPAITFTSVRLFRADRDCLGEGGGGQGEGREREEEDGSGGGAPVCIYHRPRSRS